MLYTSVYDDNANMEGKHMHHGAQDPRSRG